MPPFVPAGPEPFMALVVPELQRRGLFRRDYAGTTLREHLGLTKPAQSFCDRLLATYQGTRARRMIVGTERATMALISRISFRNCRNLLNAAGSMVGLVDRNPSGLQMDMITTSSLPLRAHRS